jgi:hypothetical protein
VSIVTKALESLLASEPSICDIRWWTEQEFNRPRATQGAAKAAQ